MLLRELADVALRLLDLQVALANGSAPVPTLWPDIYVAISTSLNRLDTLAELRKWEETADTPAALNYQAAGRDEAPPPSGPFFQLRLQHLRAASNKIQRST